MKEEEEVKKYEYPGPVKTGEFIRELRLAHNMTQEELGDAVYVTRKAVSKWENGNCYPSLDIFPRLADIFGVSLEELLSGEFKEGYFNENKCINFIIKMARNRSVILIKRFLFIISIMCLLIFFYENYNATKIYSVYCDDENIRIGRGMIVTTRAQDYINFSYFKSDFQDIDEEENVDYELYIKDDDRIISLFKFNINVADYFEKNGYKELAEVNVKDKYDKMYVKVKYINKDGEEVTKDIHLKVTLNYQSNDIYNFKLVKPTTLLDSNKKMSLYDKDEVVETNKIDEDLTIDLSFLYEMSEEELKDKFDNKKVAINNFEINTEFHEHIIRFKNLQFSILLNLKNKSILYKSEDNSIDTIVLYIKNDNTVHFSENNKEYYKLIVKILSAITK